MVNERRHNEKSPMKCHKNIYLICLKGWSLVDCGGSHRRTGRGMSGGAGDGRGHPHRATKGGLQTSPTL
jgi:hypothetical protein